MLHEGGDWDLKVIDAHEEALRDISATGIACEALDITDAAERRRVIEGVTAVISALPYDLNGPLADTAKEAGAHYFDLTEDVQSMRHVKALAPDARSAIMPQCGLAPGFISIVAHDLARRFDTVHSIQMRVGALPQFPANALMYNLTWSTVGLINEYCNPCEVIADGRRMEVRALDGYDGMDLASHDAYRSLALDPGVNALLGWHASAVRLDSPAFRLLGVSALALAERIDDPAWELVAGPSASPRQAECFIYRATDPLPRAFCVPRVVSPDELSAELEGWDPLAVACTTSDWRPRRAFTRAEVSTPEFLGNGEVRLRASLDGDGLLVLTEQHFAGWTVEIDGAPGAIVDADAIFRGVPLQAGDHELVFRYQPKSFRMGLALALISLLALSGWVLLERSRRARSA